MDVKVNNHKSWLGLSTLQASSVVARLGGCRLCCLLNVHKAYSECTLRSRAAFPAWLLGVSPSAGTPASLQPHLVM